MVTVSALSPPRCSSAAGGRRGRSPHLGRRQRRLVAAALVLGQGAAAAVRASSGCGPRCPGCATTSSCGSAGRSCIPVNLVWILFLAGVQVASDRALAPQRPGGWSSAASWSSCCWSRCSGRRARSRGELVHRGAAGRAGHRAASRCRRSTCRCRRARGPRACGRPNGPPATVGGDVRRRRARRC